MSLRKVFAAVMGGSMLGGSPQCDCPNPVSGRQTVEVEVREVVLVADGTAVDCAATCAEAVSLPDGAEVTSCSFPVWGQAGVVCHFVDPVTMVAKSESGSVATNLHFTEDGAVDCPTSCLDALRESPTGGDEMRYEAITACSVISVSAPRRTHPYASRTVTLGCTYEGTEGCADAGRRPPGFHAVTRSRTASAVALRLAAIAQLEAASVDAFRLIRADLRRFGAPRRLQRAASRAAADEVRHARVMRALARRRGAPTPSPRIDAAPARTLYEFAVDNVVEGCVRETFAALIATWCSIRAEDVHIRAAMKRIARDETRHAELSRAMDRFARDRLSRRERAALERARDQAFAELRARASHAHPESLRRAFGLPAPAEARRLVDDLQALLC